MFFATLAQNIKQRIQSINDSTLRTIAKIQPFANLAASQAVKLTVKGYQVIFPKIKSTAVDVFKGGIRYFSISNLKALQKKEAKDLRRVFKSSLKNTFLNLGISFTFHNIFKFLLLDSLLRIPGLRAALEYTVEPLFELVRNVYFGFTNIVYAKVVHKAITKNNLVRQKSLESHNKALLPPLRELRSGAFYILGIILGKALYNFNPVLAYAAEAYFLGYALIDYKLSNAGISIEAGHEISAVNNSHYLGVGLSYKLLTEIEKAFMRRYLNLPTYFDGPLSQLYIFLVHAQELPQQDPLNDYHCYLISTLPTKPSKDGIYLIPGNRVALVENQGRIIPSDQAEFGDYVELVNPLDAQDEDEVNTQGNKGNANPSAHVDDENFVCLAGNDYRVYLAHNGQWVLEEDTKKASVEISNNTTEQYNKNKTNQDTNRTERSVRMMVVNADKIPVQIREQGIRMLKTGTNKPLQVPKTFKNMPMINDLITNHFLSVNLTPVRTYPQHLSITSLVQELSDSLLKKGVKNGLKLLKLINKRVKENSPKKDIIQISEQTNNNMDNKDIQEKASENNNQRDDIKSIEERAQTKTNEHSKVYKNNTSQEVNSIHEESKEGAEQSELLNLISEKLMLVQSWPIATQGMQFIKERDYFLLFLEFFQEDFKALIKCVEEYRYLIRIATDATRLAGDATKKIEEITDNIIHVFDQLKTTLSNASSPLLSNEPLNDSLTIALKKFDEMSSYLSIPRWILMKIFLNFSPVAPIVDNFKSISDKFGEFFDLPPDVALKVLINCIKLLHRYKVSDLLDTLLAEGTLNRIKKLLNEDVSSTISIEQNHNNLQYTFFKYLTSLEENIYTKFHSSISFQDIPQNVYSAFIDLLRKPSNTLINHVDYINQKSLGNNASIGIILDYVRDIDPDIAAEQLKSVLVDTTNGIYQYLQNTCGPMTNFTDTFVALANQLSPSALTSSIPLATSALTPINPGISVPVTVLPQLDIQRRRSTPNFSFTHFSPNDNATAVTLLPPLKIQRRRSLPLFSLTHANSDRTATTGYLPQLEIKSRTSSNASDSSFNHIHLTDIVDMPSGSQSPNDIEPQNSIALTGLRDRRKTAVIKG